MNDPIYTLVLRSDAEHSRSTDRAQLLAHLTRIPGVEPSGDAPDRYTFGEADAHGEMTLELFVRRDGARVDPAAVTDDEARRCDGVEVRLPRPWVLERGPRVFALVFMLAEWAKWSVFDPQIDDTLQKEAVLSGLVAMRQAQRDAEARAKAPAEPARPSAPIDDYVPRSPEPGPPPAAAPRRPWWKRDGGA